MSLSFVNLLMIFEFSWEIGSDHFGGICWSFMKLKAQAEQLSC